MRILILGRDGMLGHCLLRQLARHLEARVTAMPGQVRDARHYAGGITLMANGDFLNPHIDN